MTKQELKAGFMKELFKQIRVRNMILLTAAGNDLILCALFGGLISGIGSGLVIRNGGALDGIEVLAIIFAKRLGITVGTFVMLYNFVLYLVAGAVIIVRQPLWLF